MSINIAAPRLLRRTNGMVGLTLPPAALALVDSLVGSFLGATRSEIMRFAIVAWLTEHHDTVEQIAKNSAPVRQRLRHKVKQEAPMDTETQPAEGSADRDETPGEHAASSQADGHATDEQPEADTAAAEGEANSDR